MNQRRRDSARQMQGRKGALDMLNAATLQQHLMIPEEAAEQETKEVSPDHSQAEESDDSHQQIQHRSPFPAV
jgi:hypothetical protein